MNCADCLHGPEVYDVKRWCPYHREMVTETHEACECYVNRRWAYAEGAYMRPTIDECGLIIEVSTSGEWRRDVRRGEGSRD